MKIPGEDGVGREGGVGNVGQQKEKLQFQKTNYQRYHQNKPYFSILRVDK